MYQPFSRMLQFALEPLLLAASRSEHAEPPGETTCFTSRLAHAFTGHVIISTSDCAWSVVYFSGRLAPLTCSVACCDKPLYAKALEPGVQARCFQPL